MASRIVVGVPVYNHGPTLRRAVESLLTQTVPPDLIHISDNASTDETEQVGRALAAEHPTVRYTRQETALTPADNFRFLLDRADAPYFTWLAADDYVLPSYIEKTSARLDASPGIATCFSQVRFVTAEGVESAASGTGSLMDDVRTNLATYLLGPGHNSPIYGLHRIDALRRAFPKKVFYALDWALVAGTLLSGKHEMIPEVLMVRDHTPTAAYMRQIKHVNPRAFDQVFPLAPMTRDLLFRQRIPLDANVLRALLWVNIEAHSAYARAHHPTYYRLLAQRLPKRLWRISPARRLQRQMSNA